MCGLKCGDVQITDVQIIFSFKLWTIDHGLWTPDFSLTLFGLIINNEQFCNVKLFNAGY